MWSTETCRIRISLRFFHCKRATRTGIGLIKQIKHNQHQIFLSDKSCVKVRVWTGHGRTSAKSLSPDKNKAHNNKGRGVQNSVTIPDMSVIGASRSPRGEPGSESVKVQSSFHSCGPSHRKSPSLEIQMSCECMDVTPR